MWMHGIRDNGLINCESGWMAQCHNVFMHLPFNMLWALGLGFGVGKLFMIHSSTLFEKVYGRVNSWGH